MAEKPVIRIRKGTEGFSYSACTKDGYLISNYDTLEQIKALWKQVEFVEEFHLFPEGETPVTVIYGYARVSTRGQAKDGNSLDAQEAALKDAGAMIIYKDVYTGKAMDRPEFMKLMEVIKGGDTLIVTKLDRFARSISQANDLITDLINRKVNIRVLNIGMIDNTPTSRLMRSMFLAFAEFERELIIERTQEGKAIARANGVRVDGRPPKYSDAQVKHAMDLLQEHSYTEVERMTGISRSTLVRKKRNAQTYG